MENVPNSEFIDALQLQLEFLRKRIQVSNFHGQNLLQELIFSYNSNSIFYSTIAVIQELETENAKFSALLSNCRCQKVCDIASYKNLFPCTKITFDLLIYYYSMEIMTKVINFLWKNYDF